MHVTVPEPEPWLSSTSLASRPSHCSLTPRSRRTRRARSACALWAQSAATGWVGILGIVGDLRHHTHAPPLMGLPSVNTCNFYFCQGTRERIASMLCHAVDPDPSPAIPQVPSHPHPSPPIPTHPHPSPYGLVQKSGGGGGGGGAGGGRARRA